ncbi:MAG: hypothetical protein WDZ52_05805 [Pseudohongiellaceae bacterium]
MVQRQSTIYRRLLLAFSVAMCASSFAQDDALDDRWVEVRSGNFHILSQRSERQTTRFANELEVWRLAAAFTISGVDSFPRAQVPNLVYLFDDVETLQGFVATDAPAFFSPSPRANFLAIAFDDEESIALGFHHYVHFLLRNFNDLRLPRWYEEGLAGYIARMQVDDNEVEFERFDRDGNEVLVSLSETLTMDRLLYNDAALASPRMIQIANLKSSALLHYLLHAYEEEGFIDRRAQLQSYLGFLLEGRNPRYAYDRSFDITTAQLDQEFHNYLLTSQRPAGTVRTGVPMPFMVPSSKAIEGAQLTARLAELALNSGNFELAQQLFERTISLDSRFARGLSGTGDALRMQELEGSDQRIARYFIEAAQLAPTDINILLDYGEYWEAELEDCENTWPSGQRELIARDVFEFFERALALDPQSPEANLAMAEYFLLSGNDWARGVSYQERAFELLPADTFIMEQAVRYAIAADRYDEAERLIAELAQPIHFFGEPIWVTDLRERLLRKRRGEPYNECD